MFPLCKLYGIGTENCRSSISNSCTLFTPLLSNTLVVQKSDKEKKELLQEFKKIKPAPFVKHAQNDLSNWHTEKMVNFHFSFTHYMKKGCLLAASQAAKQHLVPSTEWNKEQNNPVLEEEVGQKCVNQNSTIYRHIRHFQRNYSVSSASEKKVPNFWNCWKFCWQFFLPGLSTALCGLSSRDEDICACLQDQLQTDNTA